MAPGVVSLMGSAIPISPTATPSHATQTKLRACSLSRLVVTDLALLPCGPSALDLRPS
jgi:hypothetical protein